MAEARGPSRQPTVIGPRRSLLIRTIVTLLLALIVMTGLTILVIWLSIKPKRPVYFIKGASINNYTLTKDHHLYASYNLVLMSVNTNKKMHILYKKMDIKILFENVMVARGVIEPWHQHKREKKKFTLDLVSRNVELSGEVSRHLELAKLSDQVVLDVELKSRLKSKLGIWKSRYYHMKVSCEHIVAQFSDSSKESHGSCSTSF
ncbi:putative Late embryogenesis abundant protein [Helianthus annuus]|nr:putative Late embryogenesis abundant protein [Helianthus annuus]KAJ0623544.1 putative Late embryogenesis abundant protein [Helianthus annuus]